MYNLLIGGAAGQGIDTVTGILAKVLKKSGYSVFMTKDLMSRVRGGHNFTLLRFGNDKIQSHTMRLSGIVALDENTVRLHQDKLEKDGFILCDSGVKEESAQMIKLNMNDMAKEMGNPKVSGTIAVGALLKLFGESLEAADEILAIEIKEQYLEMNKLAIRKGYGLIEKRFEHLGGSFSENMLLTGSEAIGLGAISAGLRFYTAYPMSPSTSIMVYVASKSIEAGIVVEQAEDEIAAINMAIGASYAGARSMTSTSGGGFSLMVEALGLAGIAEIPVVIVNVQRPGPATGLPTRTEQADLKFMISASQGEFPRMVIAIRDHTDAFYQTARAFDIAERYQIPVIILADQYLCDGYATVEKFDTGSVRVASYAKTAKGSYRRYSITEDGISPRLIPGLSEHLVEIDSDEHDELGRITESALVRIQMVDKRARKLQKLKQELQEPEFIGADGFDTLLIGWGSTYGPIKEALGILNEKSNGRYAALVFADVYPLPQKLLKEKAAAAKRVINVEQNSTGQFADLIREQTGIACDASVLKYDGRQISGDEIADRLLKEVK